MKKQFNAKKDFPPRAGWFEVYYAKRNVVEKRYYDGYWHKGAYPIHRDAEAKGVCKEGNSWSYWFKE